ncbi:hypothetical protein TraAM80_01972 [Trypanosoma rangeli]|uniref:Guanine nucleotide-binding protein subunit beta-like protein n=1 Tax=Trypanosoma rangeli TaxID=5698 RepID=A0A3R7L9T6_TRYRA|nr:uncharacterized protein TraAM80_01972 [Trypanosoma rangeli]RNF09920.1 hypothetical protein TraAM80_01972 [Trypanosoma rangeli]|eukprot:RNF09920.1 hypothetical protein TraAM80_01972 [Trypanosoma rangeli]
MTETIGDYFVLRSEGHIHSSDVRHVSSSSGVLLTASRDHTAMVLPDHPCSDTIPPGLVLAGHTAFVNFVIFHPSMTLLDGEACIVTGSNDKHVALWNPVTAALEAVLDGHAHGVCCGVVMSPDCGDIVTGDWGGVCVVFDCATGGIKQSYTEHKTAVRAVAQLPGTSTILTASGDKTIHHWDMVTGATLAVFVGHSDVVQCICAMSATRFATGGNDATIIIWDTTMRSTPLCLLTAHYSLVYALSYCPARRLLFSASEDRSLKVWRGGVVDVASSDLQAEPVVVQSISHPCVIWSVCVTSADDVVTGGSDGVVRMWTADDEKMASVERLQALEAAVAAQTIDVKVAISAGLDTTMTSSVDQLHLWKGTQEGERRFVRTEGGTIELYVWNRGCWEKIGTVVEGPQQMHFTGTPQPRKKEYLNGVPHDYIFCVDVNSNLLKLTYDRGQSIPEAAQKFIDENSTVVSQAHKEEIESFILRNIDPSDIQQGTGTTNTAPAAGSTVASAFGGGDSEPVFSQYAREAAALQQAGATYTPSWGEALRNLQTAGDFTSDVAFSGYAREGMLLQQETTRWARAPPATARGDTNCSIVRWNTYKRFTSFNITGAKNKIDELTGNAQLSALVDRVVAAAGEEPKQALLDEVTTLYHRLPESARFPALDLLSHVLAVAAHPFGWVQLLLSADGSGGNAPGTQDFFRGCVQNLSHVTDAEALVTTRLFAHVIAALDKPPAGVQLNAEEVALLLAMLEKPPHLLLKIKHNNLKPALSALLQNAAVLLAGDPAVLGPEGAREATQGVVRLLAHWIILEPIFSQHMRDILATAMTLMLPDRTGSSGGGSSQTSAIAVKAGRTLLLNALQALKVGPEPHCREAATTLLNLLDATE